MVGWFKLESLAQVVYYGRFQRLGVEAGPADIQGLLNQRQTGQTTGQRIKGTYVSE
jgi:hypothetical protein